MATRRLTGGPSPALPVQLCLSPGPHVPQPPIQDDSNFVLLLHISHEHRLPAQQAALSLLGVLGRRGILREL